MQRRFVPPPLVLAPCLTCLCLSCLCLACLLGGVAHAGKLSRVRDQVRPPKAKAPAATSSASDDSPREQSQPQGKLASARKQVRPPKPSGGANRSGANRRNANRRNASRGGSYHRPPRRSHGGGSIGFFAFDTRRPCSPPPCQVVETHVYHQPVVTTYSAEPVYVTPPAPAPVYPSPVERLVRQFAPYPYAEGCAGCMLTTDGNSASHWPKDWAGQVQVELGSDFDGVDRTGGAFLIEGSGGLGLDFSWDSYREEYQGSYDELHIGDANLLYRIAESDHALLRLGVGAAWFGDAYDTDFGVNFTLRGDLMPADPLVFSGELDLGTLGDAQHLHAAGSVGVMLGRAEVYGGYDYRRIGDVEIEGPMVGLRVWF